MAGRCAIGIDLGTTYSCAAICEDGEVTILKNELGQNTTPSHVAFADTSSTTQTTATSALSPPITVGDAAKYQSNVNPANSIYDVKRLIGRKFDDTIVQKDITHWPFQVINDDNSPKIQVNGKSYHPEQISAMVLKYIKQQAEKHLGRTVTDAVITVPAYFNDGQRQATRDAGSIAGFNVLRIINEPTAAAIAYNHQLRTQTIGKGALKKKNVLIFDLGGGTFDLSLLTMEGSNIEVKAVDGDTHLGGQDFDNNMVDYCLEEFKKKHKVDLSKCNPKALNQAVEKFNVSKRLRRIKNECELKKINLSAAKFVQISIEVLYEGNDLNLKFKRETFDFINQPLFDRCINIVDRILNDAKMKKEDVNDVVLVGGSSRIPKVQEMIKAYFGGKAPCQNIKQDEAVAYGAAVQATEMLASKDGNGDRPRLPGYVDPVKFTDVIPHSIGIEINVGKGVKENFSVILPKNSPVPCQETKGYATSVANQTTVTINIYEGQGVSIAENHKLGEFRLENLPPNCPEGEPIDVQMKMDDEGILHVTAECPKNKVKSNISVKAKKGRLEPEQLEELRMQELYISTSTADWGTVSF